MNIRRANAANAMNIATTAITTWLDTYAAEGMNNVSHLPNGSMRRSVLSRIR